MIALALALAASPPVPLEDGWREAMVSVADLDARLAFFRDVAGWELVSQGPVGDEQLKAWRIPPGVPAQTALMRQPGATRGLVRLVAFAGARERIRSSARPWEAGGWAGLNIRVRGIEGAFRTLQLHGWQGFSDPVTFRVPPYTVREVMAVGPDGLTASFIERVDPPLAADWPGLWSRAITVFEVTADPAASARFYGEVLGLKARLSYDGPAAEPGMNLLGLPHDQVAQVTRHVRWWQQQGREDGTIASLGFRGAAGRDFADTAAPPRLGLFLVAMPVADAAARCRRAAAAGSRLVRSPNELLRVDGGRAISCTVQTPSGSWLELYTPITTGPVQRPREPRRSPASTGKDRL